MAVYLTGTSLAYLVALAGHAAAPAAPTNRVVRGDDCSVAERPLLTPMGDDIAVTMCGSSDHRRHP